MKGCGFILLAAGESSRLGRPKALLAYDETHSFLEHTIQEMRKISDALVVVVAGAHYEAMAPTLRRMAVIGVVNTGWKDGMASSIRCGIKAFQERGASCAIIVSCDQPAADGALFSALLSQKIISGKPIIASYYDDTAGIPVLFDQSYFEALLALKGEKGAKSLLILHAKDVSLVPFPEGRLDIDTLEDYEAWRAQI